MNAVQSVPLPLLKRLRLYVAIPLTRRLLLLLALALLAFGYGEVWAPLGSVEQVARQVVGGLLAVGAGAALLLVLLFWRP